MPEAFAKNINKQDKLDIKAVVAGLDNVTQQKKAFMSLIALNVLSTYLKEQGIAIISENNNLSSLLLLKDFDIANIIVENNIKIAVRAFVGKNYPQMCIPKEHFLNDLMADIYVGIRLEATIEKAELIGYIELGHINRQKNNDKYVVIDVNELKQIDSIKQSILSSSERKNKYFAIDHNKAKELFFQYIESQISSSDKEFLVRHISSCMECRQEFNNIIEIDNKLKASASKFNFEENNQEDKDYTLELFAGNPDLFGKEIEIDLLEDEPVIYQEINKKQLRRKKKKYIYGKKTAKIINTAGKLVLAGGAIYAGGQLVSAAQAINFSGMAGSAALSMTAPLAKGISETLSAFSEKEEGNEISLRLEKEPKTSENIEIDMSEDAESFDSAEEAELSEIEPKTSENIETGMSEDTESFNFAEEADLSEIEPEISEDIETGMSEDAESFDSAEEADLSEIEPEISEDIETGMSEDAESFDSAEEVDLSEIEPEISEDIEIDMSEDAESFDSAEDLTKIHNLDVGQSEDLPDLQDNAMELNFQEESVLLDDSDNVGNQINLSIDEEAEPLTIEKQEEQINLSNNDNKNTNLQETDLNKAFDDIATEYNVDDILASLDTVEVVNSSDFFDLENSEIPIENKALSDIDLPIMENIGLEKEQKENIIDQIYKDKESVPQEYQGIELNPETEDKENQKEQSLGFVETSAEVNDGDEDNEDNEDDEANDKSTARKNLLHSLDVKLASGIAAAGIAATVAVALWINNKPDTGQNLPIELTQNTNQANSLPAPIDNNNQTLPEQNNNTGSHMPVNNNEFLPQGQQPVASSNTIPKTKDLSAVLAEAFTRRTYEVNIRNISWEITTDMAQNPIFRNYIMVTGQALKSALARDLASANENALHSQMKIETVMDLKGNILEANVVRSSGSKEVDKICLKTYRTTIQFTKLPKINVNRDKIKANLIISF